MSKPRLAVVILFLLLFIAVMGGLLSDEERRVVYTAFDKLEKTMEEMERGA